MTTPIIEFFWRPGCPYCMNLEQGLRKNNIPFEMFDIWEDPKHAATVRSLARGNETVPTVRIGDESRVNPSVREMKKWVKQVAPELLT